MIAELKPIRTIPQESYPAGLMDQVLGILDSKIQYQEFKINQAVKSYVDIQPTSSKNSHDRVKFQPILDNNSRVLENIDKSSHIIKLIFIIRKRLLHSNAKFILTMISEKIYEQLTPDELKELLEKPWIQSAKRITNKNIFTQTI